MSYVDLARRYKNRVCIVTGATSGNGYALARTLIQMGARVHALGRNQDRLLILALAGAETYTLDLCDKDSITTALARLPQCIDYVFHLAGNALLGHPTEDELATFWQSDYYGPVQLLEGLKQRIRPGGGLGVVTSASAHLGDIHGAHHYQEAKREIMAWWADHQEWLDQRRVGCTLISMGAINTGIWDRAGSLPWFTRGMVHTLIPGPEKYTLMILDDVAYQRPVSYPGVAANLFPVDDRATPGVNVTLATNAIRLWFWMFGRKQA